jgi:2-iminoacetate synthase
MDLARPGDIKEHCDPNAVATFLEFLLDYASPGTREVGERLIAAAVAGMPPRPRSVSEKLLAQVRAGGRDVYC